MGDFTQEIADSLAGQAADLRAQVDAAAPDVGAALERFAGAATVSLWAAAAGENIDQLDAIIDQAYYPVILACRDPRFLFPPSPSLLEVTTYVAVAHLERFSFRLDLFDLDEAERYATEAVTLTRGEAMPASVTVRAESVLGRVAARRFELGDGAERLDDAIQHLDRAIAAAQDATALGALAGCLRRRAELAEGKAALGDLQRAADLLSGLTGPNSALSRIPVSPLFHAEWLAELGMVHLAASRVVGAPKEQERARQLCSDALHEWPSSAKVRLALAHVEQTRGAYIAVLNVRNRNAWTVLPAAASYTRLSLTEGELKDASRSAEFTWGIMQQAIDNQIDDQARTKWLPFLAAATTVAAPLQALTGNVDRAIEMVEAIRTRILQEKFPDEDRELFELSSAGYQDLSAPIRQSLRVLRDREGSSLSRARARNQLYADVQKVRQLPGFASFRAFLKAPEIASAIDSPVIYLVPGDPGGVALMVLPHGEPAVSIPLPDCPAAPPPVVERFQRAAFAADIPAGARRSAINAVCDWAWDALYQPLREPLSRYPCVHVIGASYLALVPLHAARTSNGDTWTHVCETVEIRYAPSARALIAAGKHPLPAEEPKIMIVPQPDAAEADLQGARSEVEEIASRFASPLILSQDRITPHGLRDAFGSVGWLHAACHGVADAEDPLASGLILTGGERFELRDLFDTPERHLLLTVLSACQTNVPDLRLPDESTSLAAGLLLGGCRAVIASAWQVPDRATSALMRLFYERWRQEHDDVPSALHNAQVAFAIGRSAAEWKKEWSEPYFWAGFSYTGP